MKIVTATEMQRIDESTITSGITRQKLMKNAGYAIFELLKSVYGKNLKKMRVLVAAGKGNNAGDGFVTARYLHQYGVGVGVCLMESPNQFQGDTRTNFKKIQSQKIPMFLFSPTHFQKELSKSSLVLDALFGTGLHSKLKKNYRDFIHAVNLSHKEVVSIDIPSGIDGNTGKVMGEAIQATHTITFGLPKIGLMVPPGLDYVGKLHIQNIGFPKKLLETARSRIETIGDSDIQHFIPARSVSTYKGKGGHVLIIAGSPGKTGAASLATAAAFRTGSGLVTLLTDKRSMRMVAAQIQEAFIKPFPTEPEKIQEYLERVDVVALGPGMGLNAQAERLLKKILLQSRCPLVIDADGLTLLSKHLEWLRNTKADLILTPHAGEMARLIHSTTQVVQKNRLQTAAQFARKYRVTLLLKGAATIIATPEGRLFVNLSGHPVLATAGSGDVLTGMIASLLGQKMKIKDAVKAAVYIHGKLGEAWCQRRKASRGLLASELISMIPEMIEHYL